MNQLIQGDNLQILRNMPDASVDLICTDPPFNTGRDWGAFSDKWEGGLKGYLKFMEARLEECRRVLKDTGSLYLHCDPTASHYLKVMLDGVFGIKQFRNEIVWHYSVLPSKSYRFQRMHDIILFYTKTSHKNFNILHQPYSAPSKEKFVRQHISKRTGSRYKLDESGNRIPLPRRQGVRMHDVWTKIPILSGSKERLGYPTQKTVALYERMIKASSNQHDIVLDPFAGSGTTLDAAHTLGRQWIGIDIGQTAIETIQDRLRQRHGLEYDRDYELIR